MLKIAFIIAGLGLLFAVVEKYIINRPKPVISNEVTKYERFTIDNDGTLNYRKE